MTVRVDNEQEDVDVDLARLEDLARFVLAAEGVDEAEELSVALLDEQRMTRLNETYASTQGSTDVLAFPFGEPEDEDVRDPEEPLLLGDVVLCPKVAERNAAEHGGAPSGELELLLVHGTLHLLGYDHAVPEEGEVMRVRQEELLELFRGGEHS